MKNRIDRIETIKLRVAAAKQNPGAQTHKLKFREKANFLPVIRLETSYLCYRLENSRTNRQQKGYLRMNPNLPNDFFEDPESNQAQKVQEEILLTMVLSDRDFLNDLEQYGQDEPTIITYDGFLVNGNRRTAALKKLGKAEYIECAVLPEDVTAKEIYQIEQELQIAETFKQEYDWVNELLNIRAGRDNKKYNLTERQLAKNLRISPQELKSRLLRLQLIDSFLEWKKIPGQYEDFQLDDTEQIFKELEKGLKKYSENINKQNMLKQHIYAVIENRPEKGRLYDHVRDVIKNFDDILRQLNKTDINIDRNHEEDISLEDLMVVSPGTEKTEEKKYENIEVTEIAEETEAADEINHENSKAIAEKIIEVKDDVKAEKDEKKSNEAVYISISEALRSISGLSISDNSTKLKESKNKLIELIKLGNELLIEIEKKLQKN